MTVQGLSCPSVGGRRRITAAYRCDRRVGSHLRLRRARTRLHVGPSDVANPCLRPHRRTVRSRTIVTLGRVAGDPPGPVGRPFHYSDNDPLNKQDSLGLQPTKDPELNEPPEEEPDIADPDCVTLEDGGNSAQLSSSTGQFKTDCLLVKEILDQYFPIWRQHKVPIQTAYCGNDPSDSEPGVSGRNRYCASWVGVNKAWLSPGSIYRQMSASLMEAYKHVVVHEYAHVLIHDSENGGLREQGESTWLGYLENDNENGWPAMDDFDPWADLLGGESSGSVRRAMENGLGEDKNGVDELLADCIAQEAMPGVLGGYWLRHVPQAGSGCPSQGMANASRFASGGRR